MSQKFNEHLSPKTAPTAHYSTAMLRRYGRCRLQQQGRHREILQYICTLTKYMCSHVAGRYSFAGRRKNNMTSANELCSCQTATGIFWYTVISTPHYHHHQHHHRHHYRYDLNPGVYNIVLIIRLYPLTMPLTNGCCNDDVIQLGPLRSQLLFRFVQISYVCFVHLLLQ